VNANPATPSPRGARDATAAFCRRAKL